MGWIEQEITEETESLCATWTEHSALRAFLSVISVCSCSEILWMHTKVPERYCEAQLKQSLKCAESRKIRIFCGCLFSRDTGCLGA